MAYYSVIRWVPDSGRTEAVSMGVLIYDSVTTQHWFKLNPSNERIERLWGRQNPEVWKNFYQAVTAELASAKFADVKALQRYMSEKANNLRFYELRAMVMTKPPEVEIENLYNALVLWPAKPWHG